MLGGGPTVPSTGQVVGDEPRAVEVGATVLAHGGDAADAVAATGFALAVTYPMAAGIGGGGICLVYDSAQKKAEEFDFVPHAGSEGGAYAIPGNAAGFALLQSTYGRLPWQRIVSPAERLAATGFPMSQALHARLATNLDTIRLDAELAREFLDEAGQLKPVGAVVGTPALAQTLARIRVQGAEALYRGPVAGEIAAYAGAEGGGIAAADLESYRPVPNAPLQVPIGSVTGFLPSDGVDAGRYAHALLGRVVGSQGQIIDPDHTGAAVAAATKAALDSLHVASLPRDLGAAGFAAIDSAGQAVSCAVSMGGPFGSGRTAGDTGVVLAAAPKSETSSAAFLTPGLAVSDDVVALAGAGAGGPNGTAMIVRALLDVAKGTDLTRPGALGTTGLEPYETVNVIQCQSGVCAAVADPKAFGLGAAGY